MDKVIHFEIPSDNKGASMEFYEAVFGWKLADVPMETEEGVENYTTATTTETDPKTMAPTEPGSINGAIIPRTDKVKGPVLTIGVDSIDEHLAKVTRGGGKIIENKQQIKDMGSFAYVEDPAGNVIGLWENATGTA